MQTITYKQMASPIENISIQVTEVDGVPVNYKLQPVFGYKLHEKSNIDHTYIMHQTTCELEYDFDTNPREFYAVKLPDIELPESIM